MKICFTIKSNCVTNAGLWECVHSRWFKNREGIWYQDYDFGLTTYYVDTDIIDTVSRDITLVPYLEDAIRMYRNNQIELLI